MRSRFIFLLTILAILFLSVFASASNSLWSDNFVDIYREKEREFEIGDIITVII